MKKNPVAFSSLAAAVLAGVLYATPASAARVYVSIAPPAPVVEVRAVAPGPGYFWIGGFHRWNGAAYVWVPGRWALPPRAHGVWVAGHWRHHARHGWYWIDGHWR